MDGVVSSPVVEESAVASSMAPTIPDEEDKSGVHPAGGLCAVSPEGADLGADRSEGTARAGRSPGNEQEPALSTGRHEVAASGLDLLIEGPKEINTKGANTCCEAAGSDLDHPIEGPKEANTCCAVAGSELGPPAEGTGTGNTLPGGIEIGGDNASDLGAGVGIRGVSWGGGTVLGGSQLTSLLQGERKMVGTTGPGGGPDGFGRGIPWMDRRGRVTAWLNPRLDSVILHEPHLVSPRESIRATFDFRSGKDPG